MKCYKIKNYVIVICMLVLMTGCGTENTIDAIPAGSISSEPDVVEYIESDNRASFNDSLADDEPKKHSAEELVIEYVGDRDSAYYYRDYYLENQYLIVEEECLTSFFAFDGFTKAESVRYEDIVHIDINYVGDLGFVEITDRAGISLSFVLDTEIAKEIKTVIDTHR